MSRGFAQVTLAQVRARRETTRCQNDPTTCADSQFFAFVLDGQTRDTSIFGDQLYSSAVEPDGTTAIKQVLEEVSHQRIAENQPRSTLILETIEEIA